MPNRTILITGAHRSGSTFVGKLLALPRTVGYIQEPFNRVWGLRGIEGVFPYVKEGGENEEEYRRLIEDLLHFKAKYKNPWQKLQGWKALTSRLTGGRINLDYKRLRWNPYIERLLIKDPIACMSAEWLHRSFDMDVVVLIRHPAAFVSSIRRVDWRFELNRLTEKESLWEDHLSGILDRDKDYSQISDIEDASLMWTSIYSVLGKYLDRNPAMLARTHEAISIDPIHQFRELYDELDLEFTPEIAKRIEAQTGADNPTDAEAGKTHTLKRDSRKNAHRWKTILEPAEIDVIREITFETASRFYDESDW